MLESAKKYEARVMTEVLAALVEITNNGEAPVMARQLETFFEEYKISKDEFIQNMAFLSENNSRMGWRLKDCGYKPVVRQRIFKTVVSYYDEAGELVYQHKGEDAIVRTYGAKKQN